jgi:hypothetical protein
MAARQQRRQRSDSTTAALRAMENAALGPIAPPDYVCLTQRDIPFWNGIMEARARDDWGKADLVVAAQLARCQREIEDETAAIEKEGKTIENKKGTAVLSPRLYILRELCARQLAYMRTLRMGGFIPGEPLPSARDRAAAKALEEEARKAREQVATEDDGLIPR